MGIFLPSVCSCTKSVIFTLSFLVRQLKVRVPTRGQQSFIFHKHLMCFYPESSWKPSCYLVAAVNFKHGCFYRNVLFFNQTQGDFNKLFSQLSSQCWGFMVCFICSSLLSTFDVFIFHDTSECFLVSRTLVLRSNCEVISTWTHCRAPWWGVKRGGSEMISFSDPIHAWCFSSHGDMSQIWISECFEYLERWYLWY
jgi:hypothetical protein